MRLIFQGKYIEQANARNIINSSGARAALAAEDPRGELPASTVRKPRAAPGAHVAFPLLFYRRAGSVFNVCPAGDASIRNTRRTISCWECVKRHARAITTKGGRALFDAYLFKEIL